MSLCSLHSARLCVKHTAFSFLGLFNSELGGALFTVRVRQELGQEESLQRPSELPAVSQEKWRMREVHLLRAVPPMCGVHSYIFAPNRCSSKSASPLTPLRPAGPFDGARPSPAAAGRKAAPLGACSQGWLPGTTRCSDRDFIGDGRRTEGN